MTKILKNVIGADERFLPLNNRLNSVLRTLKMSRWHLDVILMHQDVIKIIMMSSWCIKMHQDASWLHLDHLFLQDTNKCKDDSSRCHQDDIKMTSRWHHDAPMTSWCHLDGILMASWCHRVYWWHLDCILMVSWWNLDGILIIYFFDKTPSYQH